MNTDWKSVCAQFDMAVSSDTECKFCNAPIPRGAIIRWKPIRVDRPGVGYMQCATCAAKELLPIWDAENPTRDGFDGKMNEHNASTPIDYEATVDVTDYIRAALADEERRLQPLLDSIENNQPPFLVNALKAWRRENEQSCLDWLDGSEE